ncbi:hypothetical protein POM88_030394 [Heracleum sosnowskyi]|uniref:Reverse transcriptase domain-containing protein n=1 Tax=Heracleum sosnowskyi TaxID=360622 RepID=A0AAD8HWV9_9APIA|nr:hypothetical protein POM88_030394 [Heracleum sosnowskyi]
MIKDCERDLAAKDSSANPDAFKNAIAIRNKIVELYETKTNMLKQKSRISWNIEGIKILNSFTNQSSKGDAETHVLFRAGNIGGNKLNPESRQWLDKEISLDEIHFALKDSSNEKAPGPDGINMGCLKFLWEHLKFKLLEDFKRFSRSGILPNGMNSSFLALIPKGESPRCVTDYRLISLINSSVKLFMKVLAIRLNHCIKSIVSENQYAFMKERQSTESIMILNEVSHSLRTNKTEGLILKIDFEKTFDTFGWSFLIEWLQYLGFGEQWLKWIHSYLLTMRTFVLINGSPTKEFAPKRGLRQDASLDSIKAIKRIWICFQLLTEVLRGIIKINEVNGFNRALSKENFKWDIRNGNSAFFWEDLWIGREPLCICFGRLYNISKLKLLVRDFVNKWMLPTSIVHDLWSRPLRVWELEESPYSSALGRKFLHGEFNISSTVWSMFWKFKALPKVLMFVWKLSHNVLTTKSFLIMRLGQCIGSALCPRCNKEEETQEHIFWSCELAVKIWHEFFQWWGMIHKFRGKGFCNIRRWQNWFPSGSQRDGWNLAVVSCLWSMWICRNKLVFEGITTESKEIIHLVKLRAWTWYDSSGTEIRVMEQLWLLDPGTLIARHQMEANNLLMMKNYEYFCFVDGSFSRLCCDAIKAGIVGVLWRLPPYGIFKINVHACFFEEPLGNGNVSGIGVVIRNHGGRIVRMVAVCHAEGFEESLYGYDRFDIELETDNEEAFWEWRNATRYLARYGVENWDMVVILAGPVGRVFELWASNLGLGPIGFMAVHEMDLEANVVDEVAGVEDELMLAQEMI